MESREHNGHIGYTIFGYPEWKVMDNPNLNERTRLAFYVVSDATYFAIDYSGKEDINANKYDQLKINTESLVKKYNKEFLEIPNYSYIESFIATGGGNHRAYNHQGFKYEYNDEEKDKRWSLGRDKVLIPAVKVAFDTDDEFLVTFVSLTLYYTHLFADLLKGNTSQLKDISDPIRMLKEYINYCEILHDDSLNDFLQTLRDILAHAENSKISSYQFSLPITVLDYLGHNVPGIIKTCSKINPPLNLICSPKDEHIKLIY